jgi:type III restriction enzyme
MRMRFPIVEGYAFALHKNLIRCEVGALQTLLIQPHREPTATFLKATVGYHEGSVGSRSDQLQLVTQDREEYYRSTHLQAIKFQISQLIVDRLLGWQQDDTTAQKRVFKLRSRHQLFPQVYRFVDEYIASKVKFGREHPCELGLQRYVERVVERLADGIEPDDSKGEAPLMPILNRYQQVGETDAVDFKTTRACRGTRKSHINQVVVDTATWENTAAFRLEQSPAVRYYARNDHLGFFIPYEYQRLVHSYEPDFLVRLALDKQTTVVLEVKGYEDDQTKAKHNAARRWVTAVNNWGEEGRWIFHVCRNPQLLDQELAFIQAHKRAPRDGELNKEVPFQLEAGH